LPRGGARTVNTGKKYQRTKEKKREEGGASKLSIGDAAQHAHLRGGRDRGKKITDIGVWAYTDRPRGETEKNVSSETREKKEKTEKASVLWGGGK